MSVTLPTTPEGYDLARNPDGVIGCEYSGKQYLFLHTGGDASGPVGNGHLNILKSEDLGLTWDIVDTITVAPAGATPAPNISYTVCQDGATAWIAYTDSSGPSVLTADSGPLYFRAYDMSADSLGAEQTSALPVYKRSSGPNAQLFLSRMSAGNMILVYSSEHEVVSSVNWARTSYASFDGLDFTDLGLLPGQSGLSLQILVLAAGVDDTGILHVIYDAGASGVQHIGYDGAFGSAGLVVSDYGFYSNFLAYSGKIAVAFSDFATSRSVFIANSGTKSPTWTEHTFTTATPVVDNSIINFERPLALAHLGNNLHLFWTQSGSSPSWDGRDGSGKIIHIQAATSSLGTWSAEETIIGTPSPDLTWCAAQVMVYFGSTVGLGIFAGFAGTAVDFTTVENGQFVAIASSGGGGTIGSRYYAE